MTGTPRHSALIAIGMAVALSLTGCAPASAPSDATTAQLQQTVLAVTVAVSEEEWATADSTLDALDNDVAAALAAGTLSDERAAAISAAIDLVRADIADALAVLEQESTDDDNNDDEKSDDDKPGNRDNDKKNDDD